MLEKKIKNSISSLLRKAKESSLKFNLNSDLKNKILLEMSKSLIDNKDYLIKENLKDIEKAKANNKPASFIDRLRLTEKRIKEMSKSLEEIASLKDPIGEVISGWRRPNGLEIRKVRVPIGVIFIIYEARPNVTSDCIGLCFKSSNVSILRGGSLSLNSNKAIFRLLREVLEKHKMEDLFFLIEEPSYEVVNYILKEGSTFIDLVIPRGGEELIKKVASVSTIPVIKHYKGVCHIYVDEYADIKRALSICLNAKVQRPSVCNAVETILVHKRIAKKFLPLLQKEFNKFGVEIRGCPQTFKILSGIKKATLKDWSTEYLDLIVSIKVVDDIAEAINHINTYGSSHTESIVSQNIDNVEKFIKEVGSCCVFSNISTRFSDGAQFGLGAEIGISTDKLHARGPMGLEELTTYKWVVYGNGQIRR